MRPTSRRSDGLAFTLLFAVIAPLGGCTSETDSTTASIPKALAPASKEIVAYAAVPSLDSLLKGAADISTLANPVPDAPPVTLESMKAMIGTPLGDPELKGIDGTKPILVVMFDQPIANAPPLVAGFLPTNPDSSYGETLGQLGMQSIASDSLLIVAKTPEALNAAKKARALYDRIAAAKISRTARVYLSVDSLLSRYGAMLGMQIAQLTDLFKALPLPQAEPGQPGAIEGVARILKVELLGMLALLEQCDSVQLDLDVGSTGIELDSVVSAKSGSELAGFFSASQAMSPPMTGHIATGGAMMSATIAQDPVSLSKLVDKIAASVSKDPDGAALISADILKLFKQMGAAWNGTGAFSAKISSTEFSVDYTLGVKDAQKLVEMFESSAAMMGPDGALGKAYKQMGIEMSVSLQKNAREHSGVSIHSWKMAMDMGLANLGPQLNSGLMKAMQNQEFSFATVGDTCVMSFTAANVDRMIDALKANKAGTELKLESIKTFGPGRHGYFDYDLVSLMTSFLPGAPPAPAGAPMIFAGTFGKDSAQLQMKIPTALIQQLTMLGFQQQQAIPIPPAPPTPK